MAYSVGVSRMRGSGRRLPFLPRLSNAYRWLPVPVSWLARGWGTRSAAGRAGPRFPGMILVPCPARAGSGPGVDAGRLPGGDPRGGPAPCGRMCRSRRGRSIRRPACRWVLGGFLVRLIRTVVVVLALSLGVLPPAAAQAQGCRFVLGFATLHGLIPGIVGACLENEHHNPVNGDGLQATTNGLLVWRKADNVTAFTDGFRTWVNGPFGLQMRLNSQRFFWEMNPEKLPIIPT